jgi:hemerythrin-like domain-containing protein
VSTNTSDLNVDRPLTSFSRCHEGILSHLDNFGELPALLAPLTRAHQIARDTLSFFRAAVYEHHAEEERELFPAVLKSARQGEEYDQVKSMVDWLTQEHRDIERLWSQIEPQLRKLAKGHEAKFDPASMSQLVSRYKAHAQFEEDKFLPLSEIILSRDSNHMAALGLSMHMRHTPHVFGHI